MRCGRLDSSAIEPAELMTLGGLNLDFLEGFQKARQHGEQHARLDWETLATKSRRMRSRRSAWVTSLICMRRLLQAVGQDVEIRYTRSPLRWLRVPPGPGEVFSPR